jgi:curved DNA-binding protein CbpA
LKRKIMTDEDLDLVEDWEEEEEEEEEERDDTIDHEPIESPPLPTPPKTEKFIDYYSLFGCPKDSDIKKLQQAYITLRDEYSDDNSPLAKEKLKQLNKGLNTLISVKLRTGYDASYDSNREAIKKLDAPAHIDYSKYRENKKQRWYEVFDSKQSVGQMVVGMIGQLADLPEPQLQIPALASYLLIPTAVCSQSPIAFIQGLSGSGKSNLAKLARHLWDSGALLNANTTSVAMRNDIAEMKYHYPDSQTYEKLIHGLILDDLSPNQFVINPTLMTLAKVVDRTQVWKISSGEAGQNLVFHLYGLRLITSVTAFDSYPEFSELARRCLTIKTAKKRNAKVLNPESLNWSGVHQHLVSSWTIPKVEEFSSLYQEFDKLAQDGTTGMHSHNAAMSAGMFAAGLSTGIWSGKDEAIESLSAYWSWIGSKRSLGQSATLQEINDFIDKQTKKAIDLNRPVIFAGKLLQDHLESLRKNGHLDSILTISQLAEIMRGKGYHLRKGFWELGEQK